MNVRHWIACVGAALTLSAPLDAHVDLAVHGHARVDHSLRSWQRRHRLRTLMADTTAALLGLVAGLWARDVVLGEDQASGTTETSTDSSATDSSSSGTLVD